MSDALKIIQDAIYKARWVNAFGKSAIMPTDEDIAKAVLTAIIEASDTDWGVRYKWVTRYTSESEARQQLNLAQMDVPATLVTRVKAGPWVDAV